METPKILFLGNGLNRAFGGKDWLSVIKGIQTNHKISLSDEIFTNVPFPLLVIAATGGKIKAALEKKDAGDLLFGIKDEFFSQIDLPLKRLLSLGFNYILTTNYSYEIERSIDSHFKRDGTHKHFKISDFKKITCKDISNEPQYLLHTYNELTDTNGTHKIWHIHGEGRQKNTVALGQSYYGKLIAKYQSEIDAIEHCKLNDIKRMEYESWIDLALFGDVYIVGFGLDFSESDIWWLLTQKKEIGSGNIYYYEAYDKDNIAKYKLIETLGGTVLNIGYTGKPDDYPSFYYDVIDDIKARMTTEKGFAFSGKRTTL